MLQCAVQSHKSAVRAQEDAAQQPRPRFGSVDVGKDNLKRVIGPQGATVKGLEAGARAKIVAAEGGVVHLYARSAQALAALQAQVEAMTGAGIKVAPGRCCSVPPVLPLTSGSRRHVLLDPPVVVWVLSGVFPGACSSPPPWGRPTLLRHSRSAGLDGVICASYTGTRFRMVQRVYQYAQDGAVYRVRVVRVMDYGAFVELPNGFQALLHISELAHHKVHSARHWQMAQKRRP